MTDPTRDGYLDDLRESRRALTLVVPGEPIGWPRQDVRIMGPKAGPRQAFRAQLYVPETRKDPKTGARVPTRHKAWKARAVELLTQAATGDQAAAAKALPDGIPMAGPVIVDALCIFARPKRLPDRVRHLKDHAGRILRDAKPDDDNVAKAIRDAMTEAGVWADDVQATGLTIRAWGAPDEEPHTLLRVYPVAYEAADHLIGRVFGPIAWQEVPPS